MKTISSTRNTLTVIVPVYNEADSLPYFLPDLLSMCKEKQWHLIIVDDGSIVDSAQILSRYESQSLVKIIHYKINRGYGGALKSGISIYTKSALAAVLEQFRGVVPVPAR